MRMGVLCSLQPPSPPQKPVTRGPSHCVSLPPLHLWWCWVRSFSPCLAMPDGTAVCCTADLRTAVQRGVRIVHLTSLSLMYVSDVPHPDEPRASLGQNLPLQWTSLAHSWRRAAWWLMEPAARSVLLPGCLSLSLVCTNYCSQGAQTSAGCRPTGITYSLGSAKCGLSCSFCLFVAAAGGGLLQEVKMRSLVLIVTVPNPWTKRQPQLLESQVWAMEIPDFEAGLFISEINLTGSFWVNWLEQD